MAVEWRKALAVGEVAEGRPAAVKLAGQRIGIYNIEGRYHAIEDICPHANARLSAGFVRGEEIECALHEAIFHIPSGRCVAGPGGRDLATFDTRIEDGELFVRV